MKIKKLVSVILCSAMVFTFCACSNGKNGGNTDETKTEAETQSHEFTEAVLKDLVKSNLHCMEEIFVLKPLKHQETPKDGTTLCLVDKDEFKNYADFENYVRSVYCTTEADRLLKAYPSEGNTRYVNVDGDLYLNIARVGGKGYYVNWNNYTYTIDSKTDDRCEITLKAKVTWPAEVMVAEDYEVKITAVFENGSWVLTNMFS